MQQDNEPREPHNWEDFKAASDAIYEHRMEEHKSWDELKNACSNALKNNGIRVYEPRERIRTEAKDDVPYSNYAEFLESEAGHDEDGDIKEVLKANPDQLSETAGAWAAHPSETVYSDGQLSAAKRILSDLKALLTDRQYEIYQLHIEEELGLSEVARRLGVNVHSLQWPRIEAKIRKHFQSLRGGH